MSQFALPVLESKDEDEEGHEGIINQKRFLLETKPRVSFKDRCTFFESKSKRQTNGGQHDDLGSVASMSHRSSAALLERISFFDHHGQPSGVGATRGAASGAGDFTIRDHPFQRRSAPPRDAAQSPQRPTEREREALDDHQRRLSHSTEHYGGGAAQWQGKQNNYLAEGEAATPLAPAPRRPQPATAAAIMTDVPLLPDAAPQPAGDGSATSSGSNPQSGSSLQNQPPAAASDRKDTVDHIVEGHRAGADQADAKEAQEKARENARAAEQQPPRLEETADEAGSPHVAAPAAEVVATEEPAAEVVATEEPAAPLSAREVSEGEAKKSKKHDKTADRAADATAAAPEKERPLSQSQEREPEGAGGPSRASGGARQDKKGKGRKGQCEAPVTGTALTIRSRRKDAPKEPPAAEAQAAETQPAAATPAAPATISPGEARRLSKDLAQLPPAAMLPMRHAPRPTRARSDTTASTDSGFEAMMGFYSGQATVRLVGDVPSATRTSSAGRGRRPAPEAKPGEAPAAAAAAPPPAEEVKAAKSATPAPEAQKTDEQPAVRDTAADKAALVTEASDDKGASGTEVGAKGKTVRKEKPKRGRSDGPKAESARAEEPPAAPAAKDEKSRPKPQETKAAAPPPEAGAPPSTDRAAAAARSTGADGGLRSRSSTDSLESMDLYHAYEKKLDTHAAPTGPPAPTAKASQDKEQAARAELAAAKAKAVSAEVAGGSSGRQVSESAEYTSVLDMMDYYKSGPGGLSPRRNRGAADAPVPTHTSPPRGSGRAQSPGPVSPRRNRAQSPAHVSPGRNRAQSPAHVSPGHNRAQSPRPTSSRDRNPAEAADQRAATTPVSTSLDAALSGDMFNFHREADAKYSADMTLGAVNSPFMPVGSIDGVSCRSSDGFNSMEFFNPVELLSHLKSPTEGMLGVPATPRDDGGPFTPLKNMRPTSEAAAPAAKEAEKKEEKAPAPTKTTAAAPAPSRPDSSAAKGGAATAPAASPNKAPAGNKGGAESKPPQRSDPKPTASSTTGAKPGPTSAKASGGSQPANAKPAAAKAEGNRNPSTQPQPQARSASVGAAPNGRPAAQPQAGQPNEAAHAAGPDCDYMMGSGMLDTSDPNLAASTSAVDSAARRRASAPVAPSVPARRQRKSAVRFVKNRVLL
ncbi:hypothetical protein STCU_10763 [Strigomonas culicis]|uniref:Uncharacterized protein n=1 Tax=Strigomonas culicis TaxID=28005 RepID=S9TGM8_9TRYP|nr:hypothetical protein STCU_10763 [Strigomonas culicis]|eukprot:EPY17192.1 hypothetical protein STCU_10763 [Strigomonas culicis]